jgi:hypothetical protein
MGRGWKPGQLLADIDGNRFWVVEVTENTAAASESGRAWVPGSSVVDADGNGWRPDSLDGARPLVVIDPEDREQVERLRVLYHAQRNTVTGNSATGDMQAALREFANPTRPKPEEPLGLGAVVEDSKGRTYVRHPDGDNDDRPWFDKDGDFYGWDDLDVVDESQILSGGVTA